MRSNPLVIEAGSWRGKALMIDGVWQVPPEQRPPIDAPVAQPGSIPATDRQENGSIPATDPQPEPAPAAKLRAKYQTDRREYEGGIRHRKEIETDLRAGVNAHAIAKRYKVSDSTVSIIRQQTEGVPKCKCGKWKSHQGKCAQPAKAKPEPRPEQGGPEIPEPSERTLATQHEDLTPELPPVEIAEAPLPAVEMQQCLPPPPEEPENPTCKHVIEPLRDKIVEAALEMEAVDEYLEYSDEPLNRLFEAARELRLRKAAFTRADAIIELYGRLELDSAGISIEWLAGYIADEVYRLLAKIEDLKLELKEAKDAMESGRRNKVQQ